MEKVRSAIGVVVFGLLLSACGGGGGGDGGSGGGTQLPPATPTYSVTTSVTGSGGGSISPSSTTVSQGSTTSFTISPATGSEIAGVSGCGGSLAGNTYTTGAISSGCTVTATFDLNVYTVTASAGPGGSITPTSLQVDHGETAIFTIVAETGYTVASVVGCDGGLNNSLYTASPITSDCAVRVEFTLQVPPQVSVNPVPKLWELECSVLAASVENPEVVASYSWRQTLGPEATIQSPEQESTLFNAPAVSEVTRIEFVLTIETLDGQEYDFLLGTDIFPLEELSGSLFESISLEGAYKSTSGLSIASDATLTLLPGTVLRFDRGQSLVVAGTLIANGTTEKPVFLTDLKSCSDSGPGGWNGIRFSNSIGSVLSNVVIEHSYGISLAGQTPLDLTGSVVRNNVYIVTDPQGYQPVSIVRNTFHRNIDGFDLRVSGGSLISSNIFSEFIGPIFTYRSYYFDETLIRENNFLDPPEFELIRSFDGEYVPTDRPYVLLYGPPEGFGYGTVSATDNWWGTTDRDRIASMIHDRFDDVTLQEVPFEPIAESQLLDIGSEIPVDVEVPRPE